MSGARLRKSVPAVPPPVPVDPDAPVPAVTPLVFPTSVIPAPTLDDIPEGTPKPLTASAPVLPPVSDRVDPFGHAAEVEPPEPVIEGIVMPEFPIALADMADSPDPNDRLDEIERKIDALIEAVNTIGAQNQWMVETVTRMFGMFEQFMGDGNPMAMLGKMMGMRRNQKKGRDNDAAE